MVMPTKISSTRQALLDPISGANIRAPNPRAQKNTKDPKLAPVAKA
jgi:hypothetical protein